MARRDLFGDGPKTDLEPVPKVDRADLEGEMHLLGLREGGLAGA